MDISVKRAVFIKPGEEEYGKLTKKGKADINHAASAIEGIIGSDLRDTSLIIPIANDGKMLHEDTAHNLYNRWSVLKDIKTYSQLYFEHDLIQDAGDTIYSEWEKSHTVIVVVDGILNHAIPNYIIWKNGSIVLRESMSEQKSLQIMEEIDAAKSIDEVAKVLEKLDEEKQKIAAKIYKYMEKPSLDEKWENIKASQAIILNFPNLLARLTTARPC